MKDTRYRIVAIDSSSVCTGVVVADVKNSKIVKIGSMPIIPKKLDVTSLGYKKTKKKFDTYSSYIKENETYISKKEAKKRNVEVRNATNNAKIRDISSQLHRICEYLSPDVVVIERNKIFNSQLTSVLLGEVMGCVEGVCHSQNIPITKYTVEEVRKSINCSKLVKEFSNKKTPSELASMKDVTKEAIKDYLVDKYKDVGFKPKTLDESDACLVLDYHLSKNV